MGALPVFPDATPLRGAATEPARRDLPDYLPARMVNEFVYCPRLFYYEWVDGLFRESVDTVEGTAPARGCGECAEKQQRIAES